MMTDPAELSPADVAGKPLDRALLAAFAEQAAPLGPVCDAGCGPGHVAAFLGGLGCAVEGVDLSPGMVAEARRLHPAAGHPGLAEAAREWARVLRPGGRALVAFHVCDAEHAPGTARHLREWWGHEVNLIGHFVAPEAVTAACAAAGLAVEAVLRRAPYPDVEYPSERAYVLARRPA